MDTSVVHFLSLAFMWEGPGYCEWVPVIFRSRLSWPISTIPPWLLLQFVLLSFCSSSTSRNDKQCKPNRSFQHWRCFWPGACHSVRQQTRIPKKTEADKNQADKEHHEAHKMTRNRNSKYKFALLSGLLILWSRTGWKKKKQTNMSLTRKRKKEYNYCQVCLVLWDLIHMACICPHDHVHQGSHTFSFLALRAFFFVLFGT